MHYLVIDDLICPECSIGNCNQHKDDQIVRDKETGLEIKVHCSCKHEEQK